MYRSFLGIATAVIVLLLVVVFVDFREVPPDQVRVGVIASLTGNGAVRGESTLQGLELALHTIEMENLLPGKKIELVVQDVPLEKPKDGPSAYNQLIESEEVVAIIGPMGSGVVMSVAPLVDRNEIPIIVHAASVREATNGNEFLLRLWPTADQYAKSIIAEVDRRGYERIAFLSATHENTKDLSLLLSEELEEKVILEEEVDVGVKDFRTQLLKIKNAKPDAVFVNLFAGQIGIGARQARELGIDVPFFTNAVMSASELEVGPSFLEGMWFPRFTGYTESGQKEFIDFFGQEPVIPDNAAAAHDALLILALAISEVGVESYEIKNFLYKDEFRGVIGEFNFDTNGNANLPLSLLVVQDGDLVELE